MHKIELVEYAARTETPFCLGTAESYGVEHLRFVRGSGWENLALTATFHPPRGADPVEEKTAQSVRDDADNGKFTGPPGPQGDAGEVETLNNLEIQEILNMLDF